MTRAGLAGRAAAVVLLLVAGARASAPDGVTLAPPQIVLMEGAGRQIAFITEKSTQSFLVYEWKDGAARLVETLPCTTGKATGDKRVEGDLKTPEGAYRFLRYIDGRQLPPLYGAGAFVMDYPNPFDVLEGKTGSGIWMHGVEKDERVRVARDTRGCVALANPALERLRRLVRIGDTPIVVVDRLQGVPPASVASDAGKMRGFVESWRRAWESKDMEAYLRFYAPEFLAEGRDLRSWDRHKREVAGAEGERRIGIDELSVVREKDRWWVAFRQEYAAAGHRDVGRKNLFIRGEDPASWRIVSESWRGIGDRFRIVDPGDVQPQLTPALVAAIAPDAAAVAPPPRRAEEPAASAPAPASAPAAEPEPGSRPGPEEPSRSTAPGAPEPLARIDEPPAPTAPAVRRARLGARLEPATVTRRTYRLFAPHVQREGESLLVQVQLLNLRATSVRSGALVVSLPQVPGRPAEPPRAEPFAVKQGRLVALSLPDADLPLRIGLLVRDEAGNVALQQELVVEEIP